MKINIRSNADKVAKSMTDFAKRQAPYAISKAINEVAKSAEKEIQKQINSQIDNPTAFTKKSTFISYSNKNQSPIGAIVGIKDKQAEYMQYPELGGISKALSGKNKPVPVSSFKNKAGNIPRGKIKKLLADKSRYFSGTPNGRPAGLYERTKKGGLRQLAHWERQTSHKPRTRFGERVALIVQRNIDKELRSQMAAAMR